MARMTVGQLYILAVPLAAGLATIKGDAVQIGGFRYTGWMWVSLLVVGIFILLFTRALDSQRRIRFPYWPWAIWGGFIWISLIWCADPGRRNIQEALQLTMPLLVGIIASLFIDSEAKLRLLMRTFAVTLALLAISFTTARLGLLRPLGALPADRALPLTAALVGCVLIVSGPPRIAAPFLGWAACLAIAALTGGRIATFALLLIALLHPLRRNRALTFAVLLALAVLSAALFYTPLFQERFFHSGSGSLGQLFRGDFASAGRFEAWPLIWEEAQRHLVLGGGVGSAYSFVPTVWPAQLHPHNDYLRVIFEFGLVGLALFLVVVIWQILDVRKHLARSVGVTRRAFAASLLGLYVFLIVCLTDNIIVYNLWYLNPLFALLGGAYGVTKRQRRHDTTRSSDMGGSPVDTLPLARGEGLP